MGKNCSADIAAGVALAQKNDLAGAERALTDAAYRCGGPAAYRELAGVRLLQQRWTELSELAGEALRLDARDEYSARLLAAGRFNQHDLEGALAAWNLAGEPLIDLVALDGLQRTRVRAVERYAGLQHHSMLTPALLRRARIRLGELPAAAAASITFAPVTERTTELRVTVVERSALPRGLLDLAATGARAAVQRELTIPMASLSGGGELLTVAWRFWPDRPRYSATLAAPFAIGVVSASAYQERQPFSTDAPVSARAGGWIGLARWTTERLRWGGRIGGDRWGTHGTFGAVGGDVRVQFARAAVMGGATAWTGSSMTFGEARARIDWRSSLTRSGTIFLGRVGLETVSRNAPLDLWPAGDTGHARDSLLRAHPVLDSAALRIERIGRTLTHGSAGVQRWRAAGPVRIGVEGFVDAGRTSGVRGRSPILDVDPGVGLRLALPGVEGELQVNVARGLQDRQAVLSILWTKNP